MVTERKLRFIVEATVDEEAITDSPYWPGFAKGSPSEVAQRDLVSAEIQTALEGLDYVLKIEVTEAYD